MVKTNFQNSNYLKHIMRVNERIQQIKLEDIVLRYASIRWILISLYIFSTVALLRYSYIIGVFNINYFFDFLWLRYCFEYWFTNPVYLLSISAFIVIVVFGLGWKNYFIETFQFLHIPKPINTIRKKSASIMYIYILPLLAIVFLSYNVFPAIHLAHNNSLILFIIQLSSILLIVIKFAHPMYREFLKAKKPISKHTYNVISYNTSSLGRISQESKNEQRIYEHIEKTPTEHYALLTGQTDNPNLSYKGFKSVFTELARLVDGDQINGNFHNNISLHGKTTTAFKHVMSLIQSKWGKIDIIHSDSDYDTIIKVINSYCDETNKHTLNLKNEIFSETFSLNNIYDKYLAELQKITDENKKSKIVIVITHVLSESGTVITEIGKLIENLKKINKDIITVIDGAQAIGNIYVDKSILNHCNFYISCGHKWLLGSKTRGFVFYNFESINKYFDYSDLYEKSRSFSYYNYDPSQRSDETVNINPDITLVSSLKNFNSIKGGMKEIEKHNSYLADTFRSEIYGKKYIKLIPQKTIGGIVSIKVDKKFNISSGLIKRNIEFEEFDKGEKIRFSFHFYMGIKHVNKLVHILDEVVNSQKVN